VLKITVVEAEDTAPRARIVELSRQAAHFGGLVGICRAVRGHA
jgi:hypothetical protein